MKMKPTILAATVTLAAFGAAILPARADEDDWRRHEARGHEAHEHGDYYRRPPGYYYAPPPAVVYQSPRTWYQPPAVIYRDPW